LKSFFPHIKNLLIGVVLLFGTTSFSLVAQNDVTPVVNAQNARGSARELIHLLETASGWTISYSSRLCMGNDIQLSGASQTLIEHLNEIFAACPYSYVIRSNRIILRPLDPAEFTYTVSGFVRDHSSGESLPSANIFNPATGLGTVSNNFGYYSLSLSPGRHRLQASYVGYLNSTQDFELRSDTIIQFDLSGSLLLKEISVRGDRPREIIHTTQMGATLIPVEEIRQTPALLGETDLVKNIQMLPGIQGGSEGFSGLYVRGGGPDQNLILLDDVPVYNIGHLLGFFSIFNADAVKHVAVHKGSFPARYGGRLSSVIDIRMFEGNTEKLKGTLNLGLLSSGISLDGPVIKEKSGFAASFRRTYLDAIAGLVQRDNDETTNYYFFDFNAKYNHTFNPKSRLYFNTYWGRDKYFTTYNFQTVNNENLPSLAKNSINDENTAGWGNFVGAMRWNYIISPKLFSNVTATYSDYQFFIGVKRSNQVNNIWDTYEQRYVSGIRDYGVKIDLDYYPSNNHLVKFGGGAIRHDFNPGIDIIQSSESTSAPVDTTLGKMKLTGGEFHAYLEDEWTIRERLRINAGLRGVVFTGENKLYHSLEPRLAMSYELTPAITFRGAYSAMSQFIHLVSSSNVTLPTDLWLPVTDRIAPMRSKQLNIGGDIFLNSQRSYNLNVDFYYKELDNLLHYKESTGFFDYSTNWEDKLTTGYGNSYGLELLLSKSRGKLTGWLGYTLAKSTNTFPELNEGKSFAARFDRRHAANLSLNYKFTKRTDAGLMWQFGSGTPVTLPSEKYYAPEYPYYDAPLGSGYSENAKEINGFRMPAFHRIDIGFNFSKERPRTSRIWSVGIINVYGRQNPFLLYFASETDDEPGSSSRNLKQLSLFPFPIPYVKYTLKF
jgi:outer membrane receptor for ferrienterochelin and colicin